MYVCTLRVELFLPGCETAGQKRRRLGPILEKVRRHFNVSLAEVGRAGEPSRAALGAAAVGATRREAREVLERVADALANHPRAERLDQRIDEV